MSKCNNPIMDARIAAGNHIKRAQAVHVCAKRMVMRDGKFIDQHGQIVPAQFGNVQQIELLKKHNEVLAGIRAGSYVSRYSELACGNAKIQFSCTCGRDLSYTGKCDRDFAKNPQALKCYCGVSWKLSECKWSEFMLAISKVKVKEANP